MTLLGAAREIEVDEPWLDPVEGVPAIAPRELFSALWWLLSWWREVIQFDHFVGKKIDAGRSQ
jgi:hypothetical protein